MEQFPINHFNCSFAFGLFPPQSEALFHVGIGYDILIKKERSKNSCWCNQYSYFYGDYEKILCGKNGHSYECCFEVKRILVFELI